MDAKIPLIAVEIPHPGATYYGANNYVAGLIGGRHLGKWSKQQWCGAVDEVLLLQLPVSGPLPASRLVGTLEGIREVLPQVSEANVVRLDGNGQFGPSLEAVRKHLRKSRSRRMLVGAINDPSAIGALRAFEESGRTDDCAIMGQNASAEARSELRRAGSSLIGSVGYFPETYGDGIIALAIDILRRQRVPPAVFVEHHLITPANVGASAGIRGAAARRGRKRGRTSDSERPWISCMRRGHMHHEAGSHNHSRQSPRVRASAPDSTCAASRFTRHSTAPEAIPQTRRRLPGTWTRGECSRRFIYDCRNRTRRWVRLCGRARSRKPGDVRSDFRRPSRRGPVRRCRSDADDGRHGDCGPGFEGGVDPTLPEWNRPHGCAIVRHRSPTLMRRRGGNRAVASCRPQSRFRVPVPDQKSGGDGVCLPRRSLGSSAFWSRYDAPLC